MNKIKSFIKGIIAYFTDPFYRIRKLKRYVPGEVSVNGMKITFPDAASFIAIYDEIFERFNYDFDTENQTPFIIDCGANIGISTLFFKRRYPEATILAFEPDKEVYNYLQKNIEQVQDSRIILLNKGVWKEDAELEFMSDGSDAGSVVILENSGNRRLNKITAVRLSPFMNREIDFLKIDIEGAELDVLKEIGDRLNLVKRIFIEYHSFAGKPQELEVLLKTLADHNFRYYLFAPTPVRKKPFVDIDPNATFDCLINICAIKQL